MFPSTMRGARRLSHAPFSSLVTPGPSSTRSASPGFSFVLACLSGVVKVGHQAILRGMCIFFPCHSKCLHTVSPATGLGLRKGTHDATCVMQIARFNRTKQRPMTNLASIFACANCGALATSRKHQQDGCWKEINDTSQYSLFG